MRMETIDALVVSISKRKHACLEPGMQLNHYYHKKQRRGKYGVGMGTKFSPTKMVRPETSDDPTRSLDDDDVMGNEEKHMWREYLRLEGSHRIGRLMLEHTDLMAGCAICGHEFSNDHEFAVGHQTLYAKYSFINKKLQKMKSALGPEIEKPHGYDKQMLRIGYVFYFRSLRELGLKSKVCPGCDREIPDMAHFLSRMDRFSNQAENRMFDEKDEKPHHTDDEHFLQI